MSTAKLTWKDPTTRSDGTPLNTLAYINVLMSADNGNTYTKVGHAAPAQQQFSQDLTDAGTYQFKFNATDAQTPPLTSADSVVVSVTVPPPELPPPSPPAAPAAALV